MCIKSAIDTAEIRVDIRYHILIMSKERDERMKKRMLTSIVLAALLAGCGNVPAVPETQVWDEELQCFYFPGTEWGMTAEEWLSDWNLTQKDYEITAMDEADRIGGSEETVKYDILKPLSVFGYSAELSATFAAFDDGEPLLLIVEATFSGEDEDAVVKRFQEEFHADTPGYNNIVSASGRVGDLDPEISKKVYEINECWELNSYVLDNFGLTEFSWTWDAESKEVTLKCSGASAAMVHLARSDEFTNSSQKK